ncbi:MAG: RNA methyltransferase [Demequina sp.]
MPARPVGGSHRLEVTLSNPKADRVKSVRALTGRAARSKAGRFLVEGPQAVREAVRYAGHQVRDVYLTEAAAQRYGEILDSAQSADLYVHLGTPEVLEAMSPDAQGVLAVLDTSGVSLDEVIAGSPRLVAVLSHVRDPGNAGTAIRTADAAGADAVVLAGESVDPTNPKVVRASAGSLFHLPVVRSLPLEDALAALQGAGLQVWTADGGGDVDLAALQTSGAELELPTAWVFGNEAWGLTSDDLALADARVCIPIYGKAESLNLSTAVSVCLYASAAAHAASRGTPVP